MSQWAMLRTCAKCEWIYKRSEGEECPKCGFASYGARFVYGDKCYRYAVTQHPYFDKKRRLIGEIAQTIGEIKALEARSGAGYYV